MKKESKKEEKPLTTGEVAHFCYVTPMAVSKWIRSGKLEAYTTPGGHYRIKREDFMKFLSDNNMPVPRELSHQRKRLLVVDDEDYIIDFVTKSVAKYFANFTVDSARDGYEACIKIGSFKPDLVIMDVKMPGMDGIEVCKILKNNEATKDIRILGMTGYPGCVEEVLDAGAEFCLAKPFTVDQLKNYIARCVFNNKGVSYEDSNS